MRRTTLLLWITLALSLVAASCGKDEDEPARSGGVDAGAEDDGEAADDGGASDEASVSFAAPGDGETVARRLTIEMEASGFEIEPAGAVREGAGHFHVMIDVGCMDPGATVPKDDQHVHFGKGQPVGQLFLEPGEHELCLQAADGAHVALPVTDEMTVTVDGDAPFVTLGVPEGDTVSSPVAVTMEATSFAVEPAGEVHDGAGHFHVLVDRGCIGPGETIEKDESQLHFGDGSTEAELELAPGEHVLCLQMGDGAHTALPLVHFVTVVVA